MIRPNDLILGQGLYYEMDGYKTRVNNNVLVVGTSGSGKTRNIVMPNLAQAVGSYIVSDPKGNLYAQYESILRRKRSFLGYGGRGPTNSSGWICHGSMQRG